MNKLPVEIITHIIGFLNLTDRNSCSLVCKKWLSACEDPLLNLRLICGLCLYDKPKKYLDVASYTRRRLISKLSIRKSCLDSDSIWSYDARSFWVNFSNKFRMITTMHLDVKNHNRLLAELILKVTNFFTSVKTLKLYSTFLFDFLLLGNSMRPGIGQERGKREEVLHALQKIPRLIITLEGRHFKSISSLLYLNFNIHCIVVSDIFFSKFGNNIVMNNETKFPSTSVPFHTLTAVCHKFECEVVFNMVKIYCVKLYLSEVLNELCCIPKLTVNRLESHIRDWFTIGDDSSCLHQLSNLCLRNFTFSSRCYVHDWFSNDFLSSVICKCHALKSITCHGRFDKITLNQIFSCCPFIESINASHISIQRLNGNVCDWIAVKFRSEQNGLVRDINLFNDDQSSSTVFCPFLDIFSVLPFHLQTFTLIVKQALNNPCFLKMLSDRCPDIKKLTLQVKGDFKCSISMNLLSKMEKLEELTLISCNPVLDIEEEILSFPYLTKLELLLGSKVQNLTGDTVVAIAYACQRLKSLHLTFWQKLRNESLQAALIMLKDLEELNLQKCENVNSDTLEILSRFAPSLRLLKMSLNDNDFKQLVKMFEDRNPNVCVMLR